MKIIDPKPTPLVSRQRKRTSVLTFLPRIKEGFLLQQNYYYLLDHSATIMGYRWNPSRAFTTPSDYYFIRQQGSYSAVTPKLFKELYPPKHELLTQIKCQKPY